MTETKFTPGPWTKSAWGGSSLIGKLPDGTEFQICSVGGTMFGGLLDDKAQDQRSQWAREADKANAHLIAAAPELYAALKSVEWLTKIVDNELVLACPRCTSIDGEHFPGCEIDEVLRKARGEA